jgi:O-methyltransferase domain
VARLGVPDQLAGGPLTAAELAPRLGALADALDRMLTAAMAYGLVSRDGAGRYPLTPVGGAPRGHARLGPGFRGRLPGPADVGEHRLAGRGSAEPGTVADRVELVPGDFLREVPPGNLHVLCHTLHDWDDEHARTIIGN